MPKKTEAVPKKRRKVAEEAAPKRGRKSSANEEDAPEDKPKSRRSSKSKEVETSFFDPLQGIDATLDAIDKDLGMGGSSLNLDEDRMHTGSLVLDLVSGKGITAGWYTVFGPEQSCKSTSAMTILTAAIKQEVPILSYWDFEGCVTRSAKIRVEHKDTTIGALVDLDPEGTRREGGLDLRPHNLHISSAGVRQNVLSLTSKGEKPIHRLCTESGKVVEGFAHPILCVNADGLLEWKLQEDIKVGDKVVTKVAQPSLDE